MKTIDKAIRTRFLSAYSVPGYGWFRLFGAGIVWKDTRRHRSLFSERNGYTKRLMIGAWSIAALWPKRKQDRRKCNNEHSDQSDRNREDRR